MSIKFEKYIDMIVCSITIINNKNEFKGFLSSKKYKKIYKTHKDGSKKFDTNKNIKLKKIAEEELIKKLKILKKTTNYKDFGKIMFR